MVFSSLVFTFYVTAGNFVVKLKFFLQAEEIFVCGTTGAPTGLADNYNRSSILSSAAQAVRGYPPFQRTNSARDHRYYVVMLFLGRLHGHKEDTCI